MRKKEVFELITLSLLYFVVGAILWVILACAIGAIIGFVFGIDVSFGQASLVLFLFGVVCMVLGLQIKS
ncbi:hypothetical protein [Paenibacillus larvae]|uniref:Uncharacterized protein n=1 Tax=Paenibacillus larvae subsp. larvae TaxID=147375 RepID=A0A6C0QQY4_9BACL|nr:hypothetical protein [Paenibacillus larvae]AVG13036.1 hypothetical protein ERICII_02682 [Paenibacillus larvae subsp. larvae DSM 25430]MDR5596750.1 hypothetical protein [Paenibacillus larvae]QHZ51149.1 hypothetical protein ERICV_02001 [Paenibacillus larvae subsp. larvae]